jgi:alpha-ketoglutarate-dependent taurine dioxygenase
MSSRVPSLPISHATVPSYAADDFAGLLADHGYAYLDQVPDQFDHVAFCEQFGPLMPQYNDDLVFSITADDRYDHLNHPLSMNALAPHTDGYEYQETPPRYLALWCLVPPSDGGGRTTLADFDTFVETLSEEDRSRLVTNCYRFVSGIEETPMARSAEHPLLEVRSEGQAIARYSYDYIEHDADSFLNTINERLLDFFDRTHVAVAYEPGALLIWDNHRMLHGRSGYLDRERHLRRVWMREVEPRGERREGSQCSAGC